MKEHCQGKLIILSAPSGAGKSTIVKHLIERFPRIEFSISATSRAPRGEEKDGVEYYFLSNEDFTQRVANGEFVEWEEVYTETCYGTLQSELQRIWDKDNVIIFDVDVKGGISLKKIFADNALSVFIMPPSIEELKNRLVGRATDSVEVIERRINKAALEIGYAKEFDIIIMNDDLKTAITEAEQVIGNFIK